MSDVRMLVKKTASYKLWGKTKEEIWNPKKSYKCVGENRTFRCLGEK